MRDVEMDRPGRPDLPWDYGNCVLMEVGAEYPSAGVQRDRSVMSQSPLPPCRHTEKSANLE